VKPFEGRSVPECKAGGIFYSNKKTLWTAVDKAEKTEFMTIKVRANCAEFMIIKVGSHSVHSSLQSRQLHIVFSS
jgi:hypothetical protein